MSAEYGLLKFTENVCFLVQTLLPKIGLLSYIFTSKSEYNLQALNFTYTSVTLVYIVRYFLHHAKRNKWMMYNTID